MEVAGKEKRMLKKWKEINEGYRIIAVMGIACLIVGLLYILFGVPDEAGWYPGAGFPAEVVAGIVIILDIIPAIICGLITRQMGINKGYGGGFAWGFFLLFIGIIVQAVRPFNREK